MVHPSRVTSMVPGSDGSPSDRNQRDPYRAIRAMWASVSTLLTRVGRPRTPDVEEGTVRSRGRAGPPSTRLTTADSSPATNPSGAATTVTRWRSTFADLRSLRAVLIVGTARDGTYMTTLSADTAAAATFRPSSTRCGARESSSASLWLSGSPSAPLPITTALRPVTDAILRPAGKPAPPRPVSPDRSSRGTNAVPADSGNGPNRCWCSTRPGPCAANRR